MSFLRREFVFVLFVTSVLATRVPAQSPEAPLFGHTGLSLFPHDSTFPLETSIDLVSSASHAGIADGGSAPCAETGSCGECGEPSCCCAGGESPFADLMHSRESLAERGFTARGEFVQFYQGVTSGGAEQRFRYGDKVNLFLALDTGKLGLWEGGKLESHAVDWQFGQNSIQDAAGLAPVNLSLLTPKATQPAFAMTSLMYTQAFPTGLAAQVGRMNLIDLWAGFYPDYGSGTEGFMNISTMIPLSVVPSVPLITNGAGLVKVGERGIEAAFYAFESQQSPTTVGLDFPNGVTLMGAARKYTTFGGQPGTHTLFGIYATGDYTSFDEQGWIIVPGQGIVAPQQQTTWAAAYIGEQRLWSDHCNEKRYTNLRGYVGFSDVDSSPFAWTSGISVEHFGPLKSRPGDRTGIAYFYNSLNGPFQSLLGGLTPVGDVHGGEVYYNAELAPGFNVTCDLQVIEPAVRNRDTAIVLGLRARLAF